MWIHTWTCILSLSHIVLRLLFIVNDKSQSWYRISKKSVYIGFCFAWLHLYHICICMDMIVCVKHGGNALHSYIHVYIFFVSSWSFHVWPFIVLLLSCNPSYIMIFIEHLYRSEFCCGLNWVVWFLGQFKHRYWVDFHILSHPLEEV